MMIDDSATKMWRCSFKKVYWIHKVLKDFVEYIVGIVGFCVMR